MTLEQFVERDGHYRPVYLSLVARAVISPYTGTPILQEFNRHYHYWATLRDLTRAEVIRYLGKNYLGNMR